METKNFFVHDGLKVRGDTLLNGDTYNDTALAKLHVKAADNGASANLNNVNGLIIENDQTSNTNYALKLATGTGNIFSVTNAGNLGIGTTDPSASLDVIGTICADSDSWFNGVRVGLGSGNCGNNTVVGDRALYSNTTGNNNTAFGNTSLYSNTTGNFNTGTGQGSLACNTTGLANTAIGYNSLKCNTIGIYNTASGFLSLGDNTTGTSNTATGFRSLCTNTAGNWNTASGMYSLKNNTTGCQNTAHGYNALCSNTTGSKNAAVGYESLKNNTTSSNNTSHGYQSLYTNTTGTSNTASGICSLYNNTTGFNNVANGASSLFCNTTGCNNTSLGVNSLNKNTTGYHNTASGYGAVRSNTTGFRNTGTGYASLFYNTTGCFNTATGGYSLFKNTTGTYNAGYGYESIRNITTGNCNIALGYFSGCNITTGSNNITIGIVTCTSTNGDSNSIVIGNNLTGLGSNTINIGNSSNTKTVFEYGDIGIGTTNPNEKLTVSGNISASGTIYADAFNSNTGGTTIDFNDDVDLNGNLTFSSSSDILIPDNSGAALEIKEGGNVYQRFITTNGGEKIELYKNTHTSGDFTANSLSATSLSGAAGEGVTTGATIALGGDLGGSVAIDTLDGTKTLTATIQANSVALGTDTTGNYVQSLSLNTTTPSLTGLSLAAAEGNTITGLGLSATGVTAAVYGGATAIPVITVLEDGRISTASTTTVATTLSTEAGTGTGDVDLLSERLEILGTSNEITTVASNNTITIGLPDDVTISNDLDVIGNFTVNGTTVTQDVSSVLIEDPVIKLANGNTSADIKDIGFYGEYTDSGTKYTGLIRDVTFAGGNKPYVFFEGVTTDILSDNDSGSGKPTVANFADVYMGRIGVNTSTYNATTRVEINLDNGENIHFDGDGDLFVDIDRNASGDAGRLRYQTNGTDEFEVGLVGGIAGYHITDGSVNRLLSVLSSGNVGIGAYNPSYKFEITSDAGSGLISRIYNTNADGQGLLIRAGSTASATRVLQLASENDTKIMTVNSNGRVGIGTVSPDEKLHIGSGASETTNSFVRVDGNASKQKGFNIYGDGTEQWRIYTSTSSSDLRFYDGSNVAVTFEDGGNVGIGTTNPSSKLHVYGGDAIINTLNIGLGAGTNNGANTSIGLSALSSNTSGINNTAVGEYTLRGNTVGCNNAAFGSRALYNTINGNHNTAIGHYALYSNYSSDSNTAVGLGALRNTNGSNNTAIGFYSLYRNSTGTYNVANGFEAGHYIADGSTFNLTGDYNIFIGANTKALADNDQNEIVIGYNATGVGSNSAVLGNDSVTKTVLKGNVGIGTTDPSSKLHIYGADNTSTKITLTNTATSPDNQWSLHAGYNDQSLRFVGDSTTVMTLLDSGNVGIGTTSPGSYFGSGNTLVIANTASSAGITIVSNAANSGNIYFSDGTSGSDRTRGRVGYNHAANYMVFHTDAAEAMRIDSSGYVGIGNTNPNKKLSVTGEVSGTSNGTFDGRVQSNNQLRVSADYSINYFYKADNTTMLGYLLMRDDNNSFLSFPAGQDFRILHGNTSRIAVASAGNVGIGTVSPSQKLHVNLGRIAVTDGYNIGDTDADTGMFPSSNALFFQTAGTTRAVITSAGNVGIGTTSPTAGFKLDVVGSDFRVSDVGGDDGVELGWSAGSGVGFVQAYDRGASAFRNLILNNSVTILSGGNVGIGTDDPQQKLHVVGSTLISNNNYHYGYTSGGAQTTLVGIKSNNYVTVGQLNANNVGTDIYGGTGSIYLYSGSTNRLTVSSDVNVQGATDLNINGPNRRLSFTSGTGTVRTTTSNKLFLQTNSTDALTIDASQQLQFNAYGSGTHTGTQAYNLGVDSSGNIIEIDLGDGVIDGSGTANRLAYWSDSSTLSADSDLYYDSTNNYIGIGTDTPGESIDIVGGNVQADEFIGNLRGAVLFKAKAGEALTKGDAVYISGISGNTTVVSKADADDAAKMPAFGIVDQTVSLNSSVDIIKFGTVSNLDTSAFPEGTELYIGTTAGALVSSAPTGESAAIQKIAKVTRQDNSAGSMTVMGAGRTNAVPNLNEGHLFVGNASNQAVSDNTLHVDIANSKVGIGTTSPDHLLHLYKNVAEDVILRMDSNSTGNTAIQLDRQTSAASASLQFQDASTNVWGIGTMGADRLDLYEDSGDARLSITPGGNVGIGTTNPDALLHVKGTDLQVGNTTGGRTTVLGNTTTTDAGALNYRAYWAYDAYWDDGTCLWNAKRTTLGRKWKAEMSYHDDHFQISRQGNVCTTWANSDWSNFFTINSSGNVGIGTDSPSQKLEVNGGRVFINNGTNISPDTSGNGQLSITGSGYTGYITLDGTSMFVGHNSSARDLRLQTNETTRVTIDGSSGNVGIGTDNPIAPLHVVKTGAGIQPSLDVTNNQTAAADVGVSIRFSGITNSSLGKIHSAFEDAGSNSYMSFHTRTSGTPTEKMRIDSSGNVGIGTASPSYKLHTVGGAGVFDVSNASGLDHHLAVTEVATLPDWRPYPGTSTAALQLQSSATRGILLAAKSTGNQDFYNTDGLDIYVASTVGSSSSDVGTLAMSITSGGNVGIGTTDFSYTQADNTPLIGSITNNKLFVNGSLQLMSNNDAIVIGRGAATFLKDEELGFGWGGGWYQTDSTYLRVRNGKTLCNTGNACFGGSLCVGDQALIDGLTVGRGGGSVVSNTAVGSDSLQCNTTGTNNTAVGLRASWCNTTGSYNTAAGYCSLALNVSGSNNTAFGYNTLKNNTASTNVAFGRSALQENTTGTNNTAVGRCALYFNTIGRYNTAIGLSTMRDNTTGERNTAIGLGSMLFNTTGCCNTATGMYSLYCNTEGFFNTAIGYLALFDNTVGDENAALGMCSLANNTVGGGNVAAGYKSLAASVSGTNNTAIGRCAGCNITTGSCNIFIGAKTEGGSVTDSNAIAIGYDVNTCGSNTINIGNTLNTKTIFEYGNVGIGVASPSNKLEVQQLASDQSGAAAIKAIGTAYGTNKTIHAYMGTTSNTKSLLYAENSNGVVMNIAGDGNVGIGTNVPATELDIWGGRYSSNYPTMLRVIDNVTAFDADNNGGGISFGGKHTSGGVVGFLAGIQGVKENNTSGNYDAALRFLIRENGTSLLSEKMRVGSTGNVGIGTTSPNYKLEIDGTTDFGGTTTYNNGAAGLISWNASTKFKVRGQSGHALSLGANGTEDYVWIATDGNVGIGTTDPDSKLHIFSGTDTIPQFKMFGANADGVRISIGVDDADTVAGIYAWDENDGSNAAFADLNLGVSHTSSQHGIFICGSNQNVGIGTTSPSTLLTMHQTSNTSEGGLRIENSDNSSAFRVWKQPSGGASVLVDNGVDTLFLKNGNVGIGTDGPALQSGGTGLHINDTNNSELKFTNNTTGATASDGTALVASGNSFTLNNREAGSIKLGTSNTTRVTIDSSGNVGIGTTIPNDILHLSKANGAGDVSLIVQNHATTNGETASVEFRTTTSTSVYGKISVERIDGNNAFTKISTIGGGVLAERMRITSDGNVGIGTQSPGAKLDVNGISRFRDELQIYSTTTDIGAIGNYNGALNIQGTSTRDVSLGSDSYPQTVFIEGSNGKVGIGTSTPARALEVYKSGAVEFGLTAASSGIASGIFKGRSNCTNIGAGPAQSGSNLTLYNLDTTDGNFNGVGFYNSNSLITSGILGVNISHTSRHGALVFQTHNGSSLAEKMRIDKDGKVGIGTTNTGNHKLKVVGETHSTHFITGEDWTAKTGGLHIGNDGLTTGAVSFYNSVDGGGSANIYRDSNVLYVGARSGVNTRGLAVDISGNVGIGLDGPDYNLHVKGSTSATLGLEGTGGSKDTWEITSTDLGGKAVLNFRNDDVSSTILTLHQDGCVIPGTDNTIDLGSSSNRWANVYANCTTTGAVIESNLCTTGLDSCPEGSVVIWRDGELQGTTDTYSHRVMGVTAPGSESPIVMGAENILVTGDIKEGDPIVTSDKYNHGMRGDRAEDLHGKVIAEALESGSGESYIIKGMIRKF